MKELAHLLVFDDVHIGWRERSRQIEFENFVCNDACVIKGVRRPFCQLQRGVGGRGDNAVFESVAGLEAEDADGFDADVLVGGSVHDGGIGSVGDRTREDVGGASAGVRDAD